MKTHTEDEARTKWCPFVRAGAGDTGLNRARNSTYQDITQVSRCIAADCMAWQPTQPSTKRGFCGLVRD